MTRPVGVSKSILAGSDGIQQVIIKAVASIVAVYVWKLIQTIMD